MRPIRSTSRCSGVRCVSVRSSSRATLPISVAIPVAVTTARPRPRATAVPLEDHVHAVAQADRLREWTRRPSAPVRSRRSATPRRPSATPPRRAARRRRRRRPRRAGGRRRARPRWPGIRLLAPVAHDSGRRRRHPLQRRHRLLGTRLLHVAEHGVGDDDRGDHDRVVRRLLSRPPAPRRQATTTTAASSR